MVARGKVEGFSGDRPEMPTEKAAEQPTASRMDALQAHRGYESIAGALARSSDSRLNTLAGALVESRKPQVERFVDFLEKAETGELDLALIGAEIQRRKERKVEAAPSFDFNGPGFGIDLDDTVDCTALLTGFSAAKAIAGF